MIAAVEAEEATAAEGGALVNSGLGCLTFRNDGLPSFHSVQLSHLAHCLRPLQHRFALRLDL